MTPTLASGLSPDSPALANDRRIPITVLTGFLGSGKTTLLSTLLAKPGTRHIAVIVNEYSELGLDHLMVGSPRDDAVLLSGASLCCLPRDALATTLATLLDRARNGSAAPFNRVIVETSGLADPRPVLRTIIDDVAIAHEFRPAAIVTTVDAVNAEATMGAHPAAVSQLAIADSILVTKSDLAGPDVHIPLSARLRRINPWARQFRAVRGEVEPQAVSAPLAFGVNGDLGEFAPWLDADAHAGRVRADAPLVPPGKPENDRGHDHGVGIESFALIHEGSIREAGLTLWIDMLAAYRGPGLLRVKGLLNVEGQPVEIHAVQQIFHPPVELPAWPSDDHRSRLVFITRGLSEADIERTFSAFDFTPSTPGLSPENYRRFVAAMQGFRK